jgi:hypothetical protein
MDQKRKTLIVTWHSFIESNFQIWYQVAAVRAIIHIKKCVTLAEFFQNFLLENVPKFDLKLVRAEDFLPDWKCELKRVRCTSDAICIKRLSLLVTVSMQLTLV